MWLFLYEKLKATPTFCPELHKMRRLLVTIALILLPLGCTGFFKGPSIFSPANAAQGPPFQLCPSLPEADLTADQLSSQLADDLKQADEQIMSAWAGDDAIGGAVLSLVYKDKLLWTGRYGVKDMNGKV